MEKKQGIGFFERYLTIWVALCIVIGMAIGQYLPAIPQTLSKFEYANVSIPVAILIWLMIYPMMLKVDFQSVKQVGKNPKGLFVTRIVNWLAKPFTKIGRESQETFWNYRTMMVSDEYDYVHDLQGTSN